MAAQEPKRPSGSSAIRHNQLPPVTPTGGAATVRIGPDYGAATPAQQQQLLLGPQKLILPLGTIQDLDGSNRFVYTDLNEIQQLAQSSVATSALAGAGVLQTPALPSMTLAMTAPAQSGTPDSDVFGDTWVDQANPTTHHGSATSLQVAIASAVPGSDAQHGIMEADFTRFSATNQSATVGGTHTTNFFTFFASHNVAVVAQTLNVVLTTKATRPFVESTQGWAEPAAGTALKSTTVSVAAGAAAAYTVTLTDAQLNALLGQWLYVQFSSGAALSTTVFFVATRESAGPPTFAFELKSP